MASIERVVLAALITGDPLLLIGAHGTAKSYLLLRICKALNITWRHYNTSLLNYDDLVGYPLPDKDGNLQFVQTPASIWGAEAVFLDEISRCRIDLQNKLFPIIHERRIQGIELPKLRYRWAAMNPPSGDDNDSLDSDYLGSQPLDPALADRFAFVVETPGWEDLDEQQRREVITRSNAPLEPSATEYLRGVVEVGQRLFPQVYEELLPQLAHYIQLVNDLLRVASWLRRGSTSSAADGENRIALSPRRAGMLARNIAAVHVASMVLDDSPKIEESARLALRHSIPHRAEGLVVSELKLTTAHREAWRLAELPALDSSRLLATETDPVRRTRMAGRLKGLEKNELSSIVADSIASLPPGGQHALATWVLDNGVAGRLVAAVAEQCGALAATALVSKGADERVHARSTRHDLWKYLTRQLGRLPKKSKDTPLLTNLLIALFVSDDLATESDVDKVFESWRSVRRRCQARLRAKSTRSRS
jgi:MoxR-like ATPase